MRAPHEQYLGPAKGSYGTSGTNSPYGIRSWKCFSTAVSPLGIEIASASPSAVRGKYLAVWEKIGNDWKLECRFEDQWAGHWKEYIANFSGGSPSRARRRCLP
jgi:hypothetical protein